MEGFAKIYPKNFNLSEISQVNSRKVFLKNQEPLLKIEEFCSECIQTLQINSLLERNFWLFL